MWLMHGHVSTLFYLLILHPAAFPAQLAKAEAKAHSAVLKVKVKQRNIKDSEQASVSGRNLLKFHTKNSFKLNTLRVEMLERHFFVFAKVLLLFPSHKPTGIGFAASVSSKSCKVLSC